MDRRHFLLTSLAGALAAPLAAGAQQPAGTPRIGFLSLNLTAGDPRGREAFLQGLRDLGYVEGKTLVIEYRDAEGKPDRFRPLAAELAALKVSVIVTGGGTLGATAAKQATSTIPVVFGAVGDPVSEGLVSSLARPGGNVTGLAVNSPELAGKSLELLKQAVPGLTLVALLMKPDAAPAAAMQERLRTRNAAARALGIRLQVVEARDPGEFDRALADMTRARASALTAGAFMIFGASLRDHFRQAASLVDKILRGARRGELPVQQSTTFELVVNLKTAKTLGLTIPPSLLARADRVIE
jgi:putative ABC transport system substrate-binding protein